MTTTYPDGNTPYPAVAGVAAGYFHPDSIDEKGLDDLRHFAGLDPTPDWFRDFKTQLIQVLENNLQGMDIDRFEREVQPSARSTETFLREMWATIFPDEPIPGGPSEPWDATYTLIHIYLGDRDPDGNLVHPDHLRRQFQLPEDEQTPLLRVMRSELIRMLQNDFEGLDLKEFRSRTTAFYLDMRRDYKDFARHAWRYLFPGEPLPES